MSLRILYARKCDYDKAIDYYEKSWNNENAPRYTDALHSIATINHILGNRKGEIKSYERILNCLEEEWGYSKDDAPYKEVEKKLLELLK